MMVARFYLLAEDSVEIRSVQPPCGSDTLRQIYLLAHTVLPWRGTMIALRCCAISVLTTLVGCATTHGSMMRSADKLGSSAYVFVSDTDRPFPHAAELISQANHFIDT